MAKETLVEAIEDARMAVANGNYEYANMKLQKIVIELRQDKRKVLIDSLSGVAMQLSDGDLKEVENFAAYLSSRRTPLALDGAVRCANCNGLEEDHPFPYCFTFAPRK